jgi:aspartate dehydrogenase
MNARRRSEPTQPVRVGVIGSGVIGGDLARRLQRGDDPRLCLAFLHSRRGTALDGIDPAAALPDLDGIADRGPDLVVEAAHPDVTRRHGAAILRHADYLPLSTTALADDALRASLREVAGIAGTRLWLPRGALVGTEALVDWRDQWVRLTIRMDKPPDAFAAAGDGPAAITTRTTLYRGAVRGIAERFPRNVNAMVTLALATIGLDRTTAVLVADPARADARLLITAVGRDGSRLRIERRQPIVGVSGTEMAASAWSSLRAAAGRPATGAVV